MDTSNIIFGQPIDPPIFNAELPFDQAENPYAIKKQSPFQVYLLQSVKNVVWKHVESSPDLECSGILLGQPFQTANGKIKFVVVVGSVEHKTNKRSIGHVTIGPREIALVREECEERFPDLIPVGWYHSHPGHGIFLSGQDMVIVRSIYNLAWHIALVVDPIRKTAGIFRGSEAEKLGGWLEFCTDYDWLGWAVNLAQNSLPTINPDDKSLIASPLLTPWVDNEGERSKLSNHQGDITTEAATPIQSEIMLSEALAESNFQEAVRLLEQDKIFDASHLVYTLHTKYPHFKPDEVQRMWEKINSKPNFFSSDNTDNDNLKHTSLPPRANKHVD